MGVYPRNRYVPGTRKYECDSCGFDYLLSQLIKNHKNQMVCSECYEPKHPREDFRAQTRRTNAGLGPATSVEYVNLYLTVVADDSTVGNITLQDVILPDMVADDTTVNNVALTYGGGGTYLLDINTGASDAFTVNETTYKAAQTMTPPSDYQWAVSGGEIKVKNAGASAVTGTFKLYDKLPNDVTRNLIATTTANIPNSGVYEWIVFSFSDPFSMGIAEFHIEFSTDGDVLTQGDSGLYANGKLWQYDVVGTTWSQYTGGTWDMNLRVVGIESPAAPPR